MLVAGYWGWLVWACAGEWSSSGDYHYGWLVLPLALYFLWKRGAYFDKGYFDILTGEEEDEGGWGAWIVVWVSLVLVLPLEVVRQTPIYWRPILWMIGFLAAANTWAVAWLAGGRTRVKVFLFPSVFMLAAIPWPTAVEGAISFPLMQLVTGWSVGLMHLLGYPATAAGTTISLPNCTIGVEEACSGLRSLQTGLLAALAAGELARLGVWRRVVLLGIAFVMAGAGNQMRVLILALAGANGGSDAVGRFHDGAGYLVLAVLLASVGLAAWLLSGREDGIGRDAGSAAPRCGGRERRLAVGWLVLAVGVAAFLGAHGWFWWREGLSAKPAPPLLVPSGSGGFFVDDQVPKVILDVLHPDKYSYIREQVAGVPARVIGYHFYWEPRKGNANQLYHRPDHCMPGAGWRISGKVTREMIRIGGRDFHFNVFPFNGPSEQALMLWGAFLNGDPVEIEFNTDVYLNTASLWQFIRTGTRAHSFEVAALIMPYKDGRRPSSAEIQAYAARVFFAREGGGSAGHF